ncbi:hypothetical protein MJO28_013123 [Puccinia striiformis f. sp. tritici]|uniref:Uncharacterized protein n=1 Tax=Puccinia striiformis f. sp. tritici TaxID=168172 RepID=A0ACC0DZB8_9BASI|nr:hypothetical protein MJO28_013123 [Puccinia striiformis f. sp. tritici]
MSGVVSELKAPTAFIQQAKLMKLEEQLCKAVLKLDNNLKKTPVPPADENFDQLNEICPCDYAKISSSFFNLGADLGTSPN